METLLEKLEKILKSELDEHITFLDTARAFNHAIKEEDLGKIEQQRLVQDETVCRIEKLEDQRMECCTELAQSLGIGSRPFRLAQLLEKLPEHWRSRLEDIRRTLRNKVNELSKMNISNRILLEEGLRMVEHTFSSIRKCGSSRYAAYGQRGQVTGGTGPRTIFNQTV